MGFIKGQEKPLGSGRKPGTPNKSTVAKVTDFLGERGINPAEEILKIINQKELVHDSKTNLQKEQFVLGPSARADLWLELLSFCHAKPKTLEIKQSDPNSDLTEFDSVATEDLMKVINKPATSGTA